MSTSKIIGYSVLILLIIVVALPLLTSLVKAAAFVTMVIALVWLINRSLSGESK